MSAAGELAALAKYAALRLPQDVRQEVWYRVACEDERPVPAWAKSVTGSLAWLFRAAWCATTGDHDWEDESWSGPESGGIGATCRKCGRSFRTVLY